MGVKYKAIIIVIIIIIYYYYYYLNFKWDNIQLVILLNKISVNISLLIVSVIFNKLYITIEIYFNYINGVVVRISNISKTVNVTSKLLNQLNVSLLDY